MRKELIGEFFGTFVIVFVGCSAVAMAVLWQSFDSIYPIAAIWGGGVILAIYLTKSFSHSHLNPAVSLAFFFNANISFTRFISYLCFQFLGAFVAGFLVYMLWQNEIIRFEEANEIIRGTGDSKYSAMIFGEFFPNPGNKILTELSVWAALLFEGGGTFVLVMVIFLLTHTEKKIKTYTPVLIGITVAAIIVCVAPYTQAGLNPARDFGPRVAAWLVGWKDAAFPDPFHGFFTVYILGPFMGAFVAYLLHRMVKKSHYLFKNV